jgi:hypothetical protein
MRWSLSTDRLGAQCFWAQGGTVGSVSAGLTRPGDLHGADV